MIRIGTRGSALALAQANWVAARIGDAELVTITTSGDRGENISDKSRWTSELERALLQGEIDAAVHSAKDVPGELAEGTTIAAELLEEGVAASRNRAIIVVEHELAGLILEVDEQGE